MSIQKQLRAFTILLRVDAAAFKHVVFDRCINFIVWASANIIVAGYMLPAFGMSRAYGPFLLAGTIGVAGIMTDTASRVAELIIGMSEDKPLLLYATMPLSSNLMVFALMIATTLRCFFVGLLGIPLGKLFLGSQLDLSLISIPHFLMIYGAANLLYGAWTIWFACQIPNILGVSNVLMRFVFPLWFLGGFQFSQSTFLQAFPQLAKINFLNPLMYVFEGMRAALLGRTELLSIGACVGAIILFWLLAVWRGIVAMKRRLNLI